MSRRSVLVLGLAQGTLACSVAHLDPVDGSFWHYNFSSLKRTTDYSVAAANGTTIVSNVCSPPAQYCLADRTGAAFVQGAAILYSGSPEADGELCAMPNGLAKPCTQDCSVLGWGVAGGAGATWSLIEGASPRAGIRAMHRQPVLPAEDQRECGFDSWGNVQTGTLLIDFLCDRHAAKTAVLELVELLGAPRCQRHLRFRTAAACFDFAWQTSDFGACALDSPDGVATRTRQVWCGARGSTARRDELCDGPRPWDIEFCTLPVQSSPPPAPGSTATLPTVCPEGASVWERVAAVCSALTLLGLLFFAFVAYNPAVAAGRRAWPDDTPEGDCAEMTDESSGSWPMARSRVANYEAPSYQAFSGRR